MNTDELKKAIEEKKAEIEEKQKEIDNFEIDPDDYTEQYDDFLNEEGTVRVAGLEFDPAQIVKELDPTAYRCGLVDYVDGIEKSDVKEYQELEEELEELENQLEEMEEQEA